MAPFSFFLAMLAVVLNVLSFIILLRSTTLRKKRFYCLALYLSISNAVIGLEFLMFIIVEAYLKSALAVITYTSLCTIVKVLCAGTVLFSIYQKLTICLERFNATLQISNRVLKQLTSGKAITLVFVVAHIYPSMAPITEHIRNENTCVVLSSTVRILAFEIPAMLLTILTVGFYSLTIARVIRRHNKNQIAIAPTSSCSQSQQGPQGQSGHGKESTKRMKRNVFTLGFIIVLGLVSILPICCTSLIAILNENTASTTTAMKYGNQFLFINAICDPIVYTLRIRQFRQKLQCSFCIHSVQ